MLIFNPKTGLLAQDTADIRNTVQQDWRAALGQDLDTDASTPAGQLIDSEVAMIATKDADMLYLSNQFNPLTSEGVWQDALGKIYFLERQTEKPTTVSVLCRGLYGTLIPAGSAIKTDSGIMLHSLETVTIPISEQVYIMFAADVSGPIPIPANTATTIVTVIAGWDTATNPYSGVQGRYSETQVEFERRRYASVAKNSRGMVGSLYGAIGDISGVVDLVILENIGNTPKTEWGATIPGHSVYISVYGGEGADIAKVIYEKKDGGCGTAGNTSLTYIATDAFGAVYTYQIERPEPLPIYVKASIRLTPTTPENIIDLIKLSVVNNFNGLDSTSTLRVKMASVLYASRFYNPVIQAGTQDLVGVKISTDDAVWADEININANTMPLIDSSQVSVDIVEG